MTNRRVLSILSASICLLVAAPISAQGSAATNAVEARLDSDGVQRAHIVGGEYFFEPAHISVRVNIPVELTISKEPGIVPHSLVIDAPQAGIVINADMSSSPITITFTPTATGLYPYYCSKKLLFFHSHREKGMEGTLEVLP